MLTVLFVSFVTLVLEIPIFFFFKKYLFLAVLGLRCCVDFLVAARGYSVVVVCGLLVAMAFLVVVHGL